MLQRYTQLGTRMLDVGTGSGILAIASAKLGAVPDICDTDEQALMSAKDNFAKNNVLFKNAWVGSAAGANEHNGGIRYNLICANIVADVLVMITRDLSRLLFEGGTLILSGILNTHVEKVKSAYQNLQLVDEYIGGEWHTLVYQR
jgi:ribosomal protein L11 methyltransferase